MSKPNDNYRINVVLPLLSLAGPIYFGLRNYSLVFAFEWALVWTAIRWLATWKSAFAALQQFDDDKPRSWPDRHPHFMMLACVFVTFLIFEAVHVGIYFIARGWM